MRTQTFAVKKMSRPRWPIVAAIAVLLFGGLFSGVFQLTRSAAVPSTFIMVAAVASWVITISMSRERPHTVSVADGVLTASWLRAPIRASEVKIGRWVQMALDTPVGIVAHVRGRGGYLRIGSRAPGLGAHRLDGPRAQLVDCHLPAADFDTLVAALGVRPGVVAEGLTFELAEPRRALRTMAPWGIAMVCAGGAGAGLSALALPQIAITGVTVAILIAGMLTTMLDSWRIREPAHELRAGPGGLALAGSRGRPERVRAAWPAVRAVPATGVIRTRGGRYVYPTLEIEIGGATTIVVGARDSSLAWNSPMDRRRREPRWLVGSADWTQLVRLLESHGCFR